MFEPVWNRNYIDHVQITAAEDIGIGSRAGYYDTSGALRDLVQNHMLQLLTLLCMEPPVDFTADEVRDEKVKVLRAIKAPRPERRRRTWRCARSTRRGTVGGEDVPGYLEEAGVPAGLEDRDVRRAAPGGRQLALGRRADLPAHRQAPGAQGHRDRGDAQARAAPGLRAGRLARRAAERARAHGAAQRGRVAVARREDPRARGCRIRPVNMEFLYGTTFLSQSPEAYERLILDAMRGDATLFTRNDEVEAQWRICRPDPRRRGPSSTAAAAAVRGRQRRGPPEADADPRCDRGCDDLARDLTRVWSAQDTTPGEIEAALRARSSSSATPRTRATSRRAR